MITAFIIGAWFGIAVLAVLIIGGKDDGKNDK